MRCMCVLFRFDVCLIHTWRIYLFIVLFFIRFGGFGLGQVLTEQTAVGDQYIRTNKHRTAL